MLTFILGCLVGAVLTVMLGLALIVYGAAQEDTGRGRRYS